VVTAEWKQVETETATTLPDMKARDLILVQLLEKIETIPVQYPELAVPTGTLKDVIVAERKALGPKIAVAEIELLAAEYLASIEKNYLGGAFTRDQIIGQFNELIRLYESTEAAVTAKSRIAAIKVEMLNEYKSRLAALIRDVRNKIGNKRYGQALSVADTALRDDIYPAECKQDVARLRSLRDGIISEATEAFDSEVKRGLRSASRSNYDEGRAIITEAFTLFGLEQLSIPRDKAFTEIDALRAKALADARRLLQKDLLQAEKLTRAYKFIKAESKYNSIYERTASPELKQEVHALRQSVRLQKDVKAAIIVYGNRVGDIDLSSFGSSSGIMNKLTETGFTVVEEGNAIQIPWKQIGKDEYRGLLELVADAGNGAACLIIAGECVAKGQLARAKLLLARASNYRDRFPEIFIIAEKAFADQQTAEAAVAAAKAAAREAERLRKEEERRSKMGPYIATESGDVFIFPPDNPWNQDVSELPVHEMSDAYIQTIGPDVTVHVDMSIPFNIVGSDQPKVPINIGYTAESDPGPYPVPDDAWIESGPLVKGPALIKAQREGEGDRHVLVIDRDAKILYEMFHTYMTDTGWKCSSAAVFDLTSNKLRPMGWTSADAAGLPIFPGLIRYDEVMEQKEIKHALRFTVPRTQNGYILPATHHAGRGSEPELPPMGLRMRLKADFNVKSFPPPVKVILIAMQKYGIILADNGSALYITGAPHPKWSYGILNQIKSVKVSAFEAVETGPIKY